jgi:arylsulfatase A-like enzyme
MLQHGYNTYYAGKLYNGMTRELHCTPKCPGGFTEAVNITRFRERCHELLTDPCTQDLLLDPGMYTYYDSLFYHQQESDHDPPKTIPGYSTEHIAQWAIHYIDDAVQANRPFFIVAAPIAPHEATGPDVTSDFPIPEHKYAHLYPDLGVPRDALNFNPANRSGVNHIWSLELLGQENVDFLDQYYRHRQRALKSVDVMVERLVQKLDQEGVLGRTYVIYTSDNGYHLGQHRLQGGKKQCFEEDVNVPLVIRGPGIGAGSTINTPTGHVDMAPTILKMAGIGADGNPNWKLDGLAMPLDSSNTGDAQNREHVNLEYWGTFSQEGKYHCRLLTNHSSILEWRQWH